MELTSVTKNWTEVLTGGRGAETGEREEKRQNADAFRPLARAQPAAATLPSLQQIATSTCFFVLSMSLTKDL